MDAIYFRHSLGDSDDERAFYQAIGRNVVLWGRLEACITSILLRIIHHPRATFPVPHEMPVAFKRRIDLWKRVFKTEPTVEPKHRDRAIAFAQSALSLAKRRHTLMHATIGRFTGADEGAAARSYKHDGPTTFVRDFRVLTSDLVAMEEDIVALYAVISPIATVALLRSLAPPKSEGSDPPEEPETKEGQDH